MVSCRRSKDMQSLVSCWSTSLVQDELHLLRSLVRLRYQFPIGYTNPRWWEWIAFWFCRTSQLRQEFCSVFSAEVLFLVGGHNRGWRTWWPFPAQNMASFGQVSVWLDGGCCCSDAVVRRSGAFVGFLVLFAMMNWCWWRRYVMDCSALRYCGIVEV